MRHYRNICSHIVGEETVTSSTNVWSFVLAIAGTVLILSIILIIVYRLVLRKRRARLQRRVDAGQIDIEALALNEITAPQAVVSKMPLYTFLEIKPPTEATLSQDGTSPIEHDSGDKTYSLSSNEDNHAQDDTGIQKPEAAMIIPGQNDSCRSKYRLSHTQTTCAICLDDFVAGSSTVRELPCGHIFDSACIDPFLIQNCCLCPLCKKSVLPAGSYYISVTNEMVEREHLSRRP